MSDTHTLSHSAGPALGAPYHGNLGRTLGIFGIILALMGVEVALAMTRVEGSPLFNPGVSFGTLLWSLVALATTNAGVLLYYFMNLKFETRTMQLMVGVAFLFPVIYALVLISEAIWRHL